MELFDRLQLVDAIAADLRHLLQIRGEELHTTQSQFPLPGSCTGSQLSGHAVMNPTFQVVGVACPIQHPPCQSGGGGLETALQAGDLDIHLHTEEMKIFTDALGQFDHLLQPASKR